MVLKALRWMLEVPRFGRHECDKLAVLRGTRDTDKLQELLGPGDERACIEPFQQIQKDLHL